MNNGNHARKENWRNDNNGSSISKSNWRHSPQRPNNYRHPWHQRSLGSRRKSAKTSEEQALGVDVIDQLAVEAFLKTN